MHNAAVHYVYVKHVDGMDTIGRSRSNQVFYRIAKGILVDPKLTRSKVV